MKSEWVVHTGRCKSSGLSKVPVVKSECRDLNVGEEESKNNITLNFCSDVAFFPYGYET